MNFSRVSMMCVACSSLAVECVSLHLFPYEHVPDIMYCLHSPGFVFLMILSSWRRLQWCVVSLRLGFPAILMGCSN